MSESIVYGPWPMAIPGSGVNACIDDTDKNLNVMRYGLWSMVYRLKK